MNTRNFPIPVQGYDGRDEHALEANSSSNCLNIRTYQNKVQKTPGRVKLGNTIGGGPIPRAMFEAPGVLVTSAVLQGGPFLFTADTLYILNPTTGLWDATGEVFTAGPTRRFSVINSLDVVAYSNEIDHIRSAKWNGLSYVFSDLITTGKNHGARWLLGFANHIISARTRYGMPFPSEHPTQIRWSDNGNPNDWLNGDAGVLELQETNMHPITGAFILGERAYLLKQTEVIELIATGSPDPVFRAEVRVEGSGCFAGYTVAVGDQLAFWVGHDNIFMFNGSTLEAIGDPIYFQLEAAIAQQAHGNLHSQLTAQINIADGEYYLLVPGDPPIPNISANLFIYDYRRGRWFCDSAPDVTALGTASPFESNALTSKSRFVLQADTNGIVAYMDPNVYSYLGSSMTCYTTTKEFFAQTGARQGKTQTDATNLEWMNELLAVRFLSRSGMDPTTISVSVDGGTTYVSPSVASVGGSGVGVAYFQVPFVGSVRLKLANSSTNNWLVDHIIQVGYEEIGHNLL